MDEGNKDAHKCTPSYILRFRFFVGSYHALKRGTANMDVLVAGGTGIAFVGSFVLVKHAFFALHVLNKFICECFVDDLYDDK